MANKQPQIVTIDGVQYDANDFNANQIALFNHTADLDRKISSTQFQLDQLIVGRDAFLGLLREAVKEQPAEATNVATKDVPADSDGNTKAETKPKTKSKVK
jgi:hypothetical protein